MTRRDIIARGLELAALLLIAAGVVAFANAGDALLIDLKGLIE